MTWEIFLGIVALVGFIGSIGLWISKLSKILAVLETTVGALSDAIKDFKNSSKVTHKEMYDKLDDHETRIVKLEIKVDRPDE